MPVPEQIPIEPAVLTAAEPSASAVPVARPTGSKLQEVPVEMQKIDEVEFALKKGRCTADLAEQLANMLEDRTDMEQSDVENALILRARCLDKLGQTVKADRAYRAYKDAFPHGRFAAEASRSLPH
jgi:hypothetical protein